MHFIILIIGGLNKREVDDINTEVMFATGNNERSTPQWFFDRLNNIFHFTLDPCASKFNHKCDLYYTKEDNGLTKNWGGQIVFCNPPYSRKTKTKIGQEDFIYKCMQEWKENHITVVMLIPARTDTKAQQNWIFPNAKYIGFIAGRLKFDNLKDAAPFPSEVVVFTDKDYDTEIKTLSDLGFWIKMR